MFTRIVKMEFNADEVQPFLEHFHQIYPQIRNFPGCSFLELYRDKENPTIFFTYSRWEREDDLENYRTSALFKEVWSQTKKKFASRAQAWSVDTVVTAE